MLLKFNTKLLAESNAGLISFCNVTVVSLFRIDESLSSIFLTSCEFLNVLSNLLMLVVAKLLILSITKVFISKSDLEVKFGSYLTSVLTLTNKNSGSITLGTTDKGDLSFKKSSMSFFLLSGIPSAFFKSTDTITFQILVVLLLLRQTHLMFLCH